MSKPDKRRKYDDALKTAALRLARESRSTRAATRQPGLSEKLLYRWQPAQAVAGAGSLTASCEPKISAWSASWPF